MLIVGPSRCCKTVFTTKLLLDNLDLFETHTRFGTFTRVVSQGWIAGVGQSDKEGGNDKRVLDLFTKHSHPQNVMVIYLCQDMFPPGKYAKSISRNAHYIAAFKNPRDQLGMRNLLLQAFPTHWQNVQDTF